MDSQNLLLAGIFAAELGVLFLISRILVRSLSNLFYNLTLSRSTAVYIMAVIFLPGTILHELAHLLTAGVLFVPVGELEVVPEIREDGVKLGSVQIGQTDPLRRLIVGAAPVIAGIGVILSIFAFAPGIFEERTPWWMAVGIIYLIFTIANTMFSSKKDLEGAAAFLGAVAIVAVLVIFASRLTGLTLSLEWLNRFNFSGLGQFFQKAGTQMLAPLTLDIILIAMVKILSLSRFRR